MKTYLITGGTSNDQLSYITNWLEESFQLKLSVNDLEYPSKFPDLYIHSTEKSSIGIEDIRDLNQFLILKPYSWKAKVVLLAKAEKLTYEAQNALLKTLEEPPPDTFIFLLSQNTQTFLPTIISRSFIISLNQETEKIPDTELAQADEFIENLKTSDVSPNFAILDEKSSTRDTSLQFIETLILALRKKMKVDTKNSRKYASLIRQVMVIKDYLNSNTNIKLTLDKLLINMRKSLKTS